MSCVRDQHIQAHKFGPKNLPAAECQQPLGQVGALRRSTADLIERSDHFRIQVLLVLQQTRAVAKDHSEQVIEVVCHSPSELADHCQLSCLPQLGFQRLMFRDIPSDACPCQGLLAGAPQT